ncbi:MAG TPA: hypothetical protein VNK70_03030 [Candidatus Paceibacterota bacterium]|nr:hypothetical protein [Candidatus Paceibacterota bacterium]
MKMIVHGLLACRPLCGFSDLLPVHWPRGHFWTEVKNAKDMNCVLCRQVAERIRTRHWLPPPFYVPTTREMMEEVSRLLRTGIDRESAVVTTSLACHQG